jgi:S1-C subfamily serine protease
VIGIASMLLFFGIGVGVAGAALYAYYDWRLSENEQRVGELSEALEGRLEAANEGLANASESAVQDIRREAAGLQELLEQQRINANLVGRLDGSVWRVETLDENGAAAVGSAFVASSNDDQSLLVTSYGAVAAGTTEPGPVITVRSGDESYEAELYNWDPEHDLALLVVPRGGLEALPWADHATLGRIVTRPVWAAEGFGANGVAVSPGIVIDQSDVGIQHTAPLSVAFRGGPIVNGRGEVVAIASQGYTPLGYANGAVSFGIPVQAACDRILSCTGDVPGAGEDS